MEQQTRLVLSGEVNTQGEFEILPITAGEGNGWKFSDQVLKESLSLWNNVEVYIDHSWSGHSIRDLAGIIHSPVWDDSARGIRNTLKPIGPSAPLLIEMGKQMLKEDQHLPKIGFSADVIFTTDNKDVRKILKINSVDLIVNPARGGAFQRALNQIADLNPVWAQLAQTYKENQMIDEPKKPDPLQEPEKTAATAAKMQAVRDEQVRQESLRTNEEKARALLQAQCSMLLDSALNTAHLPEAVSKRIRSQFDKKVFEPSELTQSIEDARLMVSELTAPNVIQGARLTSMMTGKDNVTAAIYDLLKADRPEELAKVKPAPLSGIRELYQLMTGDYGWQGGYFPERAQFAVTTDLPGVLKNAMNKLIVMRWEELGKAGYRWWEKIVDVQHFTSLQPITGILVGEVTLLPTVAEAAAYTELGVADVAETASFIKYGGYVGLTLEMFERDETHKLIEYPKKLASSTLRQISALVSACFTSSSGTGPAMADTYHVFEAAHHFNLGTTALAAAEWEIACAAVYNQLLPIKAGGTSGKLALDPKYLLVPRALRLTAQNILYPSFGHEANYFSENQQRGELGDVIIVPDWTDATDWAAVVDPRLAPAIVIAERFGLMPELFMASDALNGALFTNDEIRLKARLFAAVLVADFRPMYKENVV